MHLEFCAVNHSVTYNCKVIENVLRIGVLVDDKSNLDRFGTN